MHTSAAKDTSFNQMSLESEHGESTLVDAIAAFRHHHDFLDIGSAHLAYYRFGSGPDLVFLHGRPLSAATFRGVAARLSNQFTCHLFDLLGPGHTVCRPDTPINLAGHVDSVQRAVRALAPE